MSTPCGAPIAASDQPWLTRPVTNLWPNLDNGYCYTPPIIFASADRATYKPSEADKPINLAAVVQLEGIPIAGAVVRIQVIPSEGEAGVVLPAFGATGEDKVFHATYTFPKFDKKRTDTLVFTCDICSRDQVVEKVKITMAPTLVGFFNGVWNTEKDARDGLKALKTITDQLKNNKPVEYQLFYNQTGCGTAGGTCLQDVAEVFMQRDQELDGVFSQRFQYFWEMLSGNYTAPTSLTGSLLARLGQPALALAQLLDDTFNLMLSKITSRFSGLLSNPPTAADTSAHVAKLQTYADDDYSMVLIAHSQGNLFMNSAYDQLVRTRPKVLAKVVHIAPASLTLRGEHALADIDLVINGLRFFGVSSIALVNLTLPTSKIDASGHTLVNTYLDATRGGLAKTKAMIKTALDGL